MSAPGVGLLVELLKAVSRLALPANDQIAYLRASGVAPNADELALELHDGIVLVPQFVSQGWLTSRNADLILEIDSILKEISGEDRPELWAEEALREAEVWEAVRAKARTFLLSK